MHAGDLIDNRFEIIHLAGSGGMGTVYRALDRSSGAAVALKVLRSPSGSGALRFAAEARVLAGLDHPHIVRFVADGIAPEGEPYIAMEWLEGESLTARLSRQGCRVEESIDLVRRVASALGAAHAKGIIHRDIKPSNLFLVGGAVESVKVLDFGIARREHATTALTRTGGVLGTPGYMAPEQARGARHSLDARADVFSLGCVLFECLTGRPAFVGAHPMALLAKLLMEEVPRVRTLRPEVPEALEGLVGRMLAKNAADRPADGAAVVEALDSLGTLEGAASTHRPEVQETLTGTEMRLVSVVVLVPRSSGDMDRPAENGQAGGISRKLLGEMRRAVASFGAKIEELANGALVAMVTGAGNPADEAALGARCALQMRELCPDAALVLLTGRGTDSGNLPVGDVLERAVSMISAESALKTEDGNYHPIRLDDVTRALLDLRFDVVEEQGRVLLLRERDVGGDARTLLGKPSPFVGRDWELHTLMELFEEGFEENRARAVLVTGPAGMGKSRLCHEFLRKLRAARSELTVLVGRGDSVGAGAAFGVLATALRHFFGIAAGEPIEVQRQKVTQHVHPLLAEPDRARVTEFLGELIGTPFPEEGSPRLRAARQNASIMTEQLQTAYIDWMTGMTRMRPVPLVLEDLHWGDVPSVKLIDAALRALRHKPFAVIAFARPEAHDRFPKLWAERDAQEIRLRDLSRRAAESLVKSMLGAKVADKTVGAIVERAAGNAFYLEELIRAVDAGRDDALPETVIGMVEARLAGLDAEARRLLRAASIFGETFWKRGVKRLLGDEANVGGKDPLWVLVEQEVLVTHADSRLAGEEEYAFRHALLREGAYAMLTERDRALGHKLAGEWLEQTGETNPNVLAEHFEQGGEGARAAAYLLHAAEHALEGNDYQEAIRLSERGATLGREPELLAGLRAVEGDARFWSGDLEGAFHTAREVTSLARAGSRAHVRALHVMIASGAFQRNTETLREPVEELLCTDPEPDAIGLLAAAFHSTTVFHAYIAERDWLERCRRRLEQVTAHVMDVDPMTAAWVEYSRGMWACHVERDFWGVLEHSKEAVSRYEGAGIAGLLPFGNFAIISSYVILGLFDQAEEELSRSFSMVPASGPEALAMADARCRMFID